MSKVFTVAGVLLASLMVAVPSRAATIDFDQFTDGGTLNYAGGTAPLIGTNITFDQVTISGAPLNNGIYECVGCSLDFTTGDHVGSIGSTEFWAAGGSFTLTGSVTGVVGFTTLLTGTWTGNPNGTYTGGGFTLGGFGVDVKDPDFLTYFGLSNPFIYTNSEISVNSCTGGGGAEMGTPAGGKGGGITPGCSVVEADLINTDTNIPLDTAPEPASLLLLGTGLLGIGYQIRRKMTSR